jgi:hypothetical protein
VGTGRTPLDEQTPTPEADEVVVFRDFFTCGLRFPCDPVLPAILDAFSVKIHQLSPTSFLEVSKFIWIMKTFGCNLSADAFARFFELVIIPDVIKVDNGQFYEAHYTCCTFNTRRQNTRKRDYANSDRTLVFSLPLVIGPGRLRLLTREN